MKHLNTKIITDKKFISYLPNLLLHMCDIIKYYRIFLCWIPLWRWP